MVFIVFSRGLCSLLQQRAKAYVGKRMYTSVRQVKRYGSRFPEPRMLRQTALLVASLVDTRIKSALRKLFFCDCRERVKILIGNLRAQSGNGDRSEKALIAVEQRYRNGREVTQPLAA